MESVTLTLGGLPTILRYGAEVSRSHSKPATSHTNKTDNVEDSQKDEGRNVRMAKKLGSL